MKENKGNYGLEKLRAVIYARKSSEDKNETSIPTQIADCKKLINSYDFMELTEIYQEDNVSGMFTEGRKEYQKMIKQIVMGNIYIVVVMRLDRFGRNMQEQLSAISLMKTLNCHYIAGDEIGDPNTAEGELIRGIILAINQSIPRQVAKNTMKALIHNATLGDSAGGKPPYGYKVIQKRYYIDDKKAPAIKLMFEKVAAGYSYQEIITELNSLGYKANNGEKFNPSTLSCMLRNPKYHGIYIYNKKGGKHRKNRVLLEDLGETINTSDIPAIISEELFNKVQKILEDKKLNISPREKGSTPYILTGLIFCKNCGKPMSGFSQSAGGKKQKYRTYICPNHTKKNGKSCFTKPINADYLETMIKSAITDSINNYLKKNSLSNKLFQDLENTIRQEMGIVSRHIKELDSKISNLANRAASTTSAYTVKAYEEQLSKHSQDKELLNGKLTDLNLKLQTVQNIKKCPATVPILDEDDIFSSVEESRVIIRLFIKKIEIDDKNDDIDITFNI